MPPPYAEKVRRIIEREEITTLYQPIFDLRTGEAIGFEAFTRGPRGTRFEQYESLFLVAAEAGLLGALDDLCRRKAIRGATSLLPEQKLFVKRFAFPDPQQHSRHGNTTETDLFEGQVDPRQVVWEMSERQPSFVFSPATIDDWTRLGCSFAIDNLGKAYSGLDKVIEFKPNYIKLAMSMSRNIHESVVKHEMVSTFTAMAEKVRAQVIVTGIEKEEELDVLRQIGVDLVQGYLLRKPSTTLRTEPLIDL
jgi:EAL domain-containing protein (putative c-di-GMP-specific phosphodiesterase class I)